VLAPVLIPESPVPETTTSSHHESANDANPNGPAVAASIANQLAEV